MIRKLEVRNFKRFRHATFELDDQIVMVGPNNCGKTTVLQAIALWAEAWHHWIQDDEASGWLRGESEDAMRMGDGGYVPTLLDGVHSVAVTTLAHLWHDREVSEPIVLAIHTEEWKVALELAFKTSGTMAVRPADAVGVQELRICGLDPFSAVYIPSSLQIEETESILEEDVLRIRLSRGGGATVLRNMLLRLSESRDKWETLTTEIHALFGYGVRDPSRGEPLNAFYRHSEDHNWLEIACAGSGFRQMLLLNSSLLYSKPQVVLIDEPDIHLHRLLQEEVYRRLPKLWGSQMIVSSHSDVLVDAVEAADHLRSVTTTGLAQVKRAPAKSALSLLTNSQIHTAMAIERILYVEGKTDVPILRAWARTIDHPVLPFLEKPFWLPTAERKKGFAQRHYRAIRTIVASFRGIELRDRNNRDVVSKGDNGIKKSPWMPVRIYWSRHEIENYLLHPKVILRFLDKRGSDDMKMRADEYMRKQWLPVLYDEPFADNEFDTRKGKDVISKLMENVGLPWNDTNCVDIAQEMRRDEVHPEVHEKLDRVAKELDLPGSQ